MSTRLPMSIARASEEDEEEIEGRRRVLSAASR
jgi:hypothetical protein